MSRRSFGLFPPFYTDCGKNIHFGKRVNLIPAPIHIGNKVWLGANVTVLPARVVKHL